MQVYFLIYPMFIIMIALALINSDYLSIGSSKMLQVVISSEVMSDECTTQTGLSTFIMKSKVLVQSTLLTLLPSTFTPKPRPEYGLACRVLYVL